MDEVWKQKAESIFAKQQRTAVNMQTTPMNDEAQREFYSIHQTKQDVAEINELLQTNQMDVTTQSETMNLSQDYVHRLQAIQNRNLSHILLNENKFGGDSEQMKNVKVSVEEVERLLSSQDENAGSLAYIEKLETAYRVAISHCQYYCDHKNPRFSTGIERKNAVLATLKYLRDEAAQLETVKKLVQEEGLDVEFANGKELLLLGRDMQDTIPESEKTVKKENFEISDLTYENFTQMIGTHNRGQVEFGKQGLKIINNGVFSRSKGEESAENLQIRRHFLDVARIKLGTRATLATLAQLTKDLGLEDVNQQTAKPLDRQTIKKIVSLINENTSEVTRHQESAKKYAENIDLSSAEYALTRDEFLASAVSQILGDETDAEDRISTPVEKETLLKAQIAAIIQEASSDFSEDFQAVKIPPLTKHQMDNLAKGNISLLRDNIFSSLQQLCMGMGHMNGGNPLRHAPIYSINHGHTIKTIAALNIRKMAAQTANERALAAQQLDTYIKEMSYKFYFMVSMSDSMPFTANEFEQLQVGAFISAGADGLEQEVEKRLPECKAWKSDQAKMNAGLNKLKVLCNQLHELSELREKAFREGLYDADAEQYKELGRNIQQALADEAGLAEMEFVATELKGTRFYTGMQEIKGRVQRAFDFEQASQKVATAMTCNGNHGERQPSENYRKVRDDYHEATQDEKLAKTLGKLNAKERNLAEILLAKKSASHSIGDDQSLLNGITQLYRKLKEMPRNEEALVEDISIGDTVLRLVKDENNSLSIVFNNLTISLPCHSVTLADHMEVDIVRNETIYGKELVQNILDGLTLQEDQVGEYSRGRQICLEYFGNKGIAASKLTNVPTTELISYAKHHQMGYLTNEGLFRMVDMIENAEHLNGSEVLNLIELMEAQKNQGLEEKVVISAQRQERRPLEEGAKWNAQEQPIVDLVSDLIFSKETWKAEKLLQNPAERMRMVLKTHSGALLAMILNPALFDNVVDKMPLPDAEEGQQGMKDIIKQGFRSFLQDEQLSQLRTVAATPVMGTFMAAAALTTALQSDEILNPLVELDAQISETVESSTAEIQRMVKAAIGKVFQEQDGQPVQQEQAVQPVQQEQTERKTMQQYRDERARLDQIIRESVSGQRGQGKFTKIILENYFSSVSMLDKRTMLASAIRNSRPSTVPADATEEQKKVMQTKAMGSYLSGLLKGAGPLLQKILQGMPLDSMPEELRTALKDMKSNLAPIPDTIVKAELWGIVERSKGNITKIELQRSLGAASVGEAFLCKMYGPQIPAEGKTVVVKLLRPDVRNRMMREKPILLACARQTDDGMEATYKGQLERIEEELDLTIEAKNVEKGGIYDAPFADVTSVKVNSMAEPTTNTLVLELAEGETVDRYMERTRSDYARLVTPLYRENETDTDVNTNPSTLNINSKNVKMVTEVREQLAQMLATLQKRQAHMINLARAWVTEGIYGAGFYHGDLHAGNIMINDEKLTVIDFGNATSLTRDQQTHIMRMMAAASAGKMELFREGFHALMKNTDENFYEQNKEALGDEIKRIFALGSAEDAAQRIFATLMRAQEMGMELPPAIFNFSQSQIRLQASIDEMNRLITDIQAQLKEFASVRAHGVKEDYEHTIDLHLKFRDRMGTASESVLSEELKAYRGLNISKEALQGILNADQKRPGVFASDIKDRLQPYMDEGNKSVESLRQKIDHDSTSPFMAGDVEELLGMYACICDQTTEAEYQTFCREFQQAFSDYLDECKQRKSMPKDEKTPVVSAAKNRMLDYLNRLAEKFNTFVDRLSADGDRMKEAGEDQREALEAAFMEKFEKCSIIQLMKKASGFKNAFSKMYALKHREEADPVFENWFADTDNYGEQMREAYTAFRNAQKDGSMDAMVKFTAFMNIYRKAVDNRVTADRNSLYHEVNYNSPADFVDVMGNVISENVRASLARLGKSAFSLQKEMQEDAERLYQAKVAEREEQARQEQARQDQMNEEYLAYVAERQAKAGMTEPTAEQKPAESESVEITENQEVSVTEEVKETPVTEEEKEVSVTQETQEAPVVEEVKETPVTEEIKETPVTEAEADTEETEDALIQRNMSRSPVITIDDVD